MGARRAIAIVALIAGAACNALTGVGDLEPTLGLDSTDDAGDEAAADGAGADGSSDGNVLDQVVDVGPDTRTLVKAITFEDGLLVHPVTGASTTSGDASVLGVASDAGADADADADPDAAASVDAGPLPDVITGRYSMYVASTAFATQTLPMLDAVYVTARFRIEQPVGGATGILRIASESAPNLDVVLQSSMSLTASLGATNLGTSAVLEMGKVYRLGVHVQRTMGNGNPNGAVDVFVTKDGTAFGAAFAARTKVDIAQSTAVSFGMLGSPSAATFDDITIDSAFLR